MIEQSSMNKLRKQLLPTLTILAVFSAVVYCASIFLSQIHQPSKTTQHQARLLLEKNNIECSSQNVQSAIKTGDIGTLQTLYIAGADISRSDDTGNSPLHLAIENNQWRAIPILKKAGCNIDSADSEGIVPLAKLLAKNKLLKAEQFIKAGASLNFTDKDGDPALISYLKTNNKPLFSFLLSHGANPNITDTNNVPALACAFQLGNINCFNELIQAGANPERVSLQGESLIIALLENSTFDISSEQKTLLISSLINAGVDVETSSVKSGHTPLQIAIQQKDIQLLKHLLKYTSDTTPCLWMALNTQQYDAAKILLKHGANANQQNEKGITPIIAMTDLNRADMITALLDHGANAEQTTAHGQRLIFYSIAKKNTEATLALLSHKRHPDITKPMVYPISEEFRKIYGKKGYIDWNLRNVKGHNPYTLAILTKNVKVAEKFIQMGVSKHKRTTTKLYPIQFASGTNDVPMMQLILGAPYQDDKQERNFIIDLSEQKVYFYKSGKLFKSSRCSTGRSGYRTPTGTFVITDKTRHKVSNIYKGAKMPYFQRFSSSAIGFHTGYVGSRYASHGCIRLPNSTASFFFKHSKVGDRVKIRK